MHQLTGYNDFDLGQINARVFDICYLAISFLVGNIRSGYDSKLPLSELEKNALPVMMMSIELLFVAYFMKQNDSDNAETAAVMFMWLWENHHIQVEDSKHL